MNRFQRGADRVEGGDAVTGCVPVTAASFLDVAVDLLELVMPDLPTLGALLSVLMLVVAICGGQMAPDVDWVVPLDGAEQLFDQVHGDDLQTPAKAAAAASIELQNSRDHSPGHN